ncbi:MAG: geranylgeranyl reductase family protein [Promethearchaeota archaeon]
MQIPSHSQTYDIIVIGAGPGGSTAAYLLAKNNYKVLLIDKDKFPRYKLCGGLLSMKTINLIKRIYDLTPDDLIKERIIDYITPFYEINYRNERKISRINAHFNFFLVDRTIYDNFLLDKAKNLGVEVMEGISIDKINIESCTVELKTGVRVKSAILIGADGANSIVRREFTRQNIIRNKDWLFNLGTGLECFINRQNLKSDQFNRLILTFGFCNYGYNWVFPNKDKIVLGVGALNRKNKRTLLNSLKNFISSLNIDFEKCSSVIAHPVPYGNFSIKPIYKNKVLLIGDAAGITNPLWGEGIYYAQKTAELAVVSIINHFNDKSSPLTYYENLLHEDIYPKFKSTLKLRWLLFNKLNFYLKYYPIQIFLSIYRNILSNLSFNNNSSKILSKKQHLLMNLDNKFT